MEEDLLPSICELWEHELEAISAHRNISLQRIFATLFYIGFCNNNEEDLGDLRKTMK